MSNPVLRFALAAAGRPTGTDADLLARFAADRDEAAFAEVVRRHRGLVRGTARRLVHDPATADDVTQAAFLVLATKAGAGGWGPTVGPWLYAVAARLARRARTTRRPMSVVADVPAPAADPAAGLLWAEVRAALDDALARLPASLRDPLVLCYLEGMTRDEAAAALGRSVVVVKSRLARGRARLRTDLARRGVTLPAALAGVLAADAGAGGAAAADTARLAAGYLATGAAPARVLALAHGATAGWKVCAVLTGLVAACAGGVVGLSAAGPAPADGPPKPAAAATAPAPRTDVFGDPLPDRAVARLGTVRQRAPGADLAVSPDGKEIVTVDPLLTVRRFDAATGALRSAKVLDAPGHTFKRLSPSGRYLLTTGLPHPPDNQYEAVVWDLKGGKPLHTHTVTGQMHLECAEFSPDETRVGLPLVSSAESVHSVRVWDLWAGKVRTIQEFKKSIGERYAFSRASFSPDGTRLAYTMRDIQLRVHDLTADKPMWDAWNYHSNIFFFTPDGKFIVNRNDERLDAATGQVMPWPRKPPGYKVRDKVFGITPNSDRLAFTTLRQGIVFWNPETGKLDPEIARPGARPDDTPFTTNEPTYDWSFTPDGTGLVRRAGIVQRWDVRTGRPMFPDTRAAGHTEAVGRVVFSPDGRRLASRDDGRGRRALVWDVATGRPTAELTVTLGQHLAFTPDGRQVLAVPNGASGGNPAVQAWDAATGAKAQTFDLADAKEFHRSSRSAGFVATPDGRTVAILTSTNGGPSDQCMLSVWDAHTGKQIRHGKVPWADDSAFTPDATAVLTFDHRTWGYRLIDLTTEAPRLTFAFDAPTPDLKQPNRRRESGNELAVSPDGRFAAGTARFFNYDLGRYEAGDIFLGDTATGRQLAKFDRAGDAALAFSPDSRLFTVVDGNELRLWETATWQPVGSIRRPDHPAAPDRPWAGCVAVSPDGRRIATGHPDGTITLWDATFGATPAADADGPKLWDDLAADASRAAAAGWRLVAAPEVAMPLLRDKLSPVQAAPGDQVRRLVADLGVADYRTREAATKALAALGETAGPGLRTALAAGPSAETRQRIEQLLTALTADVSGEGLRTLRAVEALERIGTADARRLLAALAAGIPEARLTRDARESLARLNRRPSP